MFDNIQFIGTQRSGSNLLRLMLNQHSSISAHHPPHLLMTFMPLMEKYGDISRYQTRRVLVQDMCDWVDKNPVTWEPVSFDVASIAKTSENIFDIFKAFYQAKCEQDGATIWCCKSTHNIEYIEELNKHLNPFFVYLYRDGRDVALSFQKAYVGPKHIYEIARKWQNEQIHSLRFLDSIPSKRYMKISYEQLIEEPAMVLTKLCEKLNIQYEPNMLRYYSSEESMITSNAGRMWKNVNKPILEDNRQKFRSDMTVGDIEMFETVASGSLMKLGYEVLTQASAIFSESDLLSFHLQDQELRKLSMEMADVEDKEHRKPQEELMKAILDRLDDRIQADISSVKQIL